MHNCPEIRKNMRLKKKIQNKTKHWTKHIYDNTKIKEDAEKSLLCPDMNLSGETIFNLPCIYDDTMNKKAGSPYQLLWSKQ